MLSKEDRNEAIETCKAHIRQIQDVTTATLNTLVDDDGLVLEVDDDGHLIANQDDLADLVEWLNDRVDDEFTELGIDEHGHLHVQDVM